MTEENKTTNVVPMDEAKPARPRIVSTQPISSMAEIPLKHRIIKLVYQFYIWDKEAGKAVVARSLDDDDVASAEAQCLHWAATNNIKIEAADGNGGTHQGVLTALYHTEDRDDPMKQYQYTEQDEAYPFTILSRT